ncbi:serine/threonine protein kinase [Nostocaceae cyanobacterium CENA369]|uniref:non-specific serine/threonine protein kinase n=1 Tax=Dendronalium phyllosphericum CENA369 TaxID=1725256 RepID=A0A8J7LGP9_9NOST|nr:serine/threonine-protein kinase [Dendronalium phyllosphericum]MBH8577267.1 serine/threonine protein kinase [Dendronalium phyllosphericum CENA369]
MIGQILGGRYQIQARISKGGFSITSTAIDIGRPGNPQCIVKQFKSVSTDPETLAVGKRLFETEAANLERLGHHDQIPRLLAFFQENQEFYLVQEYIEGHDLSQELIPSEKLSERTVIKLLEDILEVLAFVHQENLIHRDLKPSNIRRRRSDGKIVLIDFGAVKEVSTVLINPLRKTDLTIGIGTPGYVPGEQAKGQPTFPSDIYAVGIIAIQALTGINPYPGGLPTNSQTGEIMWRDRAQVSPQLANIIDTMVRYDYRQRYHSATKALQAVKSLSSKSLPWKLWLSVGVAIITPFILWILSQLINLKHTLSTYAEPKFGITISYPSDNWQPIKPGDDFGGEVIQFIPKNQKPVNSCTLEITININDLSQQLLSLDEYKKMAIQKVKNNNPNQQITDDSTPSTTLSDFNAYKLIYTRQEGQCKLQVIEVGTVRNSKAYFITYTAESGKYSQYLPTAEAMIQSFKIMEKN